MNFFTTTHLKSPLFPTHMFEYNQILPELQDVFIDYNPRKMTVFDMISQEFCIFKQMFYEVASVDIKPKKVPQHNMLCWGTIY